MKNFLLVLSLFLIINISLFAQAKYAYVVAYPDGEKAHNGTWENIYISDVFDVTKLDLNDIDKIGKGGYGEKSKKDIYEYAASRWFNRIARKSSDISELRVVFYESNPYQGCITGNEDECFTFSKSKMESIRDREIASYGSKTKVIEL